MIILPVRAQELHVLTFETYLNSVKDCHIGYLVEKYNVSIAEANEKAARVFPDPELSVSYANNQNWNLQMGYGIDVGLNYTLELGGKRKARMSVARSEKELTEALLEDYFRNLRADATIAYLDVLKQKRGYEMLRLSYEQMLALANADSIRYRLGSITEVDARRSGLEAAGMLNDLYAGEGDLRESMIRLSLFLGNKELTLPDSVAGELFYVKREFDPEELVITAQNNRADLQAAIKSGERSQNNLQLAKANRAIDLGLSIGGGYSSIVRNDIAPAPAFKGLAAGISIPLKFSNTNKGELKAAQLAVRQSELEYEAIERQIASEVIRACNQYKVSSRQAELFDTGMLQDAERILQQIIYSYERGETGILEVLNARRTCLEMQMTYSETLYNYAVALVELERACGISFTGIAETLTLQ
jgi:cobalt-zinc-cadmium efflux system outer membrane protein